MVGEQPPKQSSKRNLATSSGDILDSFLCTPSRTRIVAAFVSITTSNCNKKITSWAQYQLFKKHYLKTQKWSQHSKILAVFMHFFLLSTECDILTHTWQWKIVILATSWILVRQSDLQWSANLQLTPHMIWKEGFPRNSHTFLKFNTWTVQQSPVVRWYFI